MQDISCCSSVRSNFVVKISNIGNNYRVVEVEITEVIKGATNDKKATFINSIPDLIEEEEYIFCLRKDGDGFVLTNSYTNSFGVTSNGMWSTLCITAFDSNKWSYDNETINDMNYY